MRPKSQFGGAHITLKRLWDEYVARTGMSQEEFGEAYGIGSQGMVSQYLLGTVPLNYEVAAKFARGLNCSIEEICPDMARVLLKDILPVLRRSLRRRRVACIAAAYLLSSVFQPAPADARILHSANCAPVAVVIRIALRRLREWLRGANPLVLSRAGSGL
jgi:transcriptional regulator with XRE-family HTH domain